MDRYKMGSRMTDKDHKEQGNKYFNANKFDSAIESYSKVRGEAFGGRGRTVLCTIYCIMHNSVP
jgi:hypothetical protein